MEKRKLPNFIGNMKIAMNKATEETLSQENNVLHLETVVYHCLCLCREGSLDDPGSCITTNIVSNLNESTWNQLEDELKDITSEIFESNTVPSELINPTSVMVGNDVLGIFSRIRDLKIKGFFLQAAKNNEDEITLDDFIYGTLLLGTVDDTWSIVNTLKSYGFSASSYSDSLVKDFLLDFFGKVLNSGEQGGSPTINNASGDDYNSEQFEMDGEKSEIHLKKTDPDSPTPRLDEFGINMTEEAKKGRYDAVIGRETEVAQIIEILCCRKKNNAMVIGKAGTGKTALVEYLAQKIASGDVPDELKDKKIISLSTTTLTAGTQYRGQLEQRVQEICDEVAKNRDIIIFIDEFHSAVSESSSDISQMLKPSLSRGELTLIAGTTYEEYKKYIEKDSALKRRFQKVFINEPSEDETLLILKGLRDKYSSYHGVDYPDEILAMCVTLSKRYLYDRNSPDRAIDLMDVSGSHAKLCHPTDTLKLESLKDKLERVKQSKAKAVTREDYSKAFDERQKQKELENKIEEYLIDVKKKNKVTEVDVATVVSELVNIPIDKILNPDIEKIRTMAPELKKHVIGQDESIDIVAKLLSRQFLGLRDENVPPSLYISGGTGTGKTYLAEEIAKTIFGTQDAMLRIDCGELTQPHTVTKLIGAPPSYVGFGEVALFDSVRERPQRLILVDEADKLCDEILNTIFLNILTTGFITLSNGIEVSFKECIFIFTSNDGTRELEAHGSGIGFGMEDKKTITKDIVMKAIKKRIRPEVINRFSGIVIFNPLGIPEMEKIYELELDKVKNRLQKKGLRLTVSTEVRDKIISELDLRYGARDLTRGISKWIEDAVCDEILNHSTDISKKKNIEIRCSKSGDIEVKLKK